jgi:phage tail-like protein
MQEGTTMPTTRENRYSQFKFLVSLGGGRGSDEPGRVVGGFSDVTSLVTDVNYSGDGNGKTARMAGTYKFAEVTLKRGLVGHNLMQWINTALDGTASPREVQITMFDEARNLVGTFTLHNARAMKATASALAAKGDEVALEELSLVHEGIEHRKP